VSRSGQRPDLLVVLGPTASGKTRLAVELARRVGGEILSADSRQVYRGLDIGAGKDLQEYGEVPYHLIDIVGPTEEYSVFRFQRDCFAAMEQIRRRGRWPILVGGSGLYLDAITQGYRFVEVPHNPVLREELAALTLEQLQARLLAQKPELHNTTDLLVRPRVVRAIEIAEGEADARAAQPPVPEVTPLYIGLRWPRPVLRQRITTRMEARLQEGMVAEAQRLLEQGVSHEQLQFFGLEYRFLSRYLQGELNYNDMKQKLNSAIHQFAKRQDTWFRKMERRGDSIHWLDGNEAETQLDALLARLLE